MTISPSLPKNYTADEYLDLEVKSEIRHEFRNGEIVEMTGGTPAHNEITGNLLFLLKASLRKQPYSIFITDQRLWIPAVDLYTYPDVMITQRPPELKPGRQDTVINPILIAETLSDSTEGYDRGQKFAYYRTIETFQEYLLIDQYQPHVEHYVKQSDNKWLLADYSSLEDHLQLLSVNAEIDLADLYEGISLQ